jgi:hypothetical protein
VVQRFSRFDIFDDVLRRSSWRRPVGTPIDRWDPGGFLRSQNELEALLSGRGDWFIQHDADTALDLDLDGLVGDERSGIEG